MKIVLFGIGEIYKKNKDSISKEDEVTAFIDNNGKLQGSKCDGIEVYSPSDIHYLPYDKIIIMSVHYIEMRNQLIRLGCERKNILYYPEYISRQSAGKLYTYFGKQGQCPMVERSVKYTPCSKNEECVSGRLGYGKELGHTEKRCLIITNPLGYHGGAIVAVYTALELLNRGYEAVIASPEGNEKFIDEFNKAGITFLVYPNLQFAKWDELFWVRNFDKVIVNTYPMMLCAIEIAKHRDVVFWLHEADIVYPSMVFWKDIILENLSMPALRMYAVSSVAREDFYHNVGKCKIGLLPYGIPDINKTAIKKDQKLTFAVIGKIQPIKQQMLFLKAVRLLNECHFNCDFLIIGGKLECYADYARKVEKEAEGFSNVRIAGELTRKELESMYGQIDIVVIPSSQEAMSLVATEALMYGKVCILGDIVGMAAYVKPGEDGLIFKSGDVADLVKQMSYCIKNREKVQELGKSARRTYEQYFSMKAFGDRLEQILDGQGDAW